MIPQIVTPITTEKCPVRDQAFIATARDQAWAIKFEQASGVW